MNLLAGKKDTFWHNKSLILLITGVADVIVVTKLYQSRFLVIQAMVI